MEVKNPVYYLEKNYALSALFFTAAYFANKKRFVEVFTEQKGFYLSAVAASASVIGGERYIKGFPNTGTNESVAAKALIVAAAALALRPASKILLRREVIHFEDAMKFGGVQIGAVVIPHAIKAATGYVPNLTASADNLEQEIGAIERVPLSAWEITNGVSLFEVDTLLANLSDDDHITNGGYKIIYHVGDKHIITDPEQQEFEEHLRSDMCGGGPQRDAVKVYARKIFAYLWMKHQAWEQSKDSTPEEGEALADLIRRSVLSYIDAHHGCVDQTLSQIQNIAISLIEDFGLDEVQKVFAVAILNYRTHLIKEVVRETGEYHAADLEITLARRIYSDMGWTMSDALKSGAAYPTIASPANFLRALTQFHWRYNPVKYLVNEINFHTGRKMHNKMLDWYANQIFKHEEDGAVSSQQKERISNRLRKDPNGDSVDFLISGFGNESDGAKLYFLVKSGVITV